MSLLCTLGTSWAVVPEAFLLGNGEDHYDRVVVLTTSGTGDSVEKCAAWFGRHYPEVDLKILGIENLPDLACAADHHRFEEALFQQLNTHNSTFNTQHSQLPKKLPLFTRSRH